MQSYRKIFSEGLNADDDFSVITKGQWVNASNIRTFTTDSGATGRIEAVGGTSLLFNSLPSGDNKCIGAVADDSKKWIVFKNWNSNGNHGIYCYSKTAGTTYTVLLNADVTGGLNFDKYSRVWSNCKIIGDLEYLTDNINQPRKLNLKAAINAYQPDTFSGVAPYTFPLLPENITVIRRAPQLPLECAKMKSTDLGVTVVQNFIKNLSLQFCYYYVFRDYETSVTSTRSLLFNYNFDEETDEGFDVIGIKIPLTEKIQQDVQEIYLVAKNNESGKYFVINRWSKEKNVDLSAINLHNAGTKQLEFVFKGDYFGAALDDVFAPKPFEYIPLLSKTLELAKDRLFLGDNLLGYGTPASTSLNTSLLQGGATSETDSVYWTTFNISIHGTPQNMGSGAINFSYTYYVVQLPHANNGYYTLDDNSTPATADFSDLILAGNTLDEVTQYFVFDIIRLNPGYDIDVMENTLQDTTTPVTVNNIGLVVPLTGRFFKTDSVYKVSIVFYDAFQRKCGVVDLSNTITIPTRKFTYDSYYTYIKWNLSNTNALAEIPVWATHYQIVITQSRNIDFFIEGVATKYAYVKKDDAGAYTETDTVPGDDYVGLAIDLSELLNNNIGYSFQDKDLAVIYRDTVAPVYTEVIGTDGKWAILNYKDIGTIASTPAPFVYEIRSPKVQGADDVFYEVSQCYPITNAGTSSRVYSSLSGQIRGDTYIVKRTVGGTDYYMESISPNDKHPLSWFTDAGRPNAVDRIGQKQLPDNIVFSDTYLQGTKVNGLSSFSALNDETLGSENGSIQKLQLSNKTQSDGTVMLAICENETVSIYLGEQELFDTQGSAFIAKASGVIGSFKALKGSLGTRNPESVFEYNGQVFWWDIRNACAVQYSNNGLYPISKKKFVRPAKLFSKKFSSLSIADIEALESDPYIVGGFDPYHQEVLFSIPSTETPPKGFLVDYPEVVYPYDIYDGQGKTLVYKHEADVWFGSMSFQSEFFVKMDNDLYSFKDGALYIHNQSNLCNFYGVQSKAQLMFASNPGAIHTFLSIGLESNKTPSWVHFRTEDPYTQSSDLPYVGLSEFVTKQGVIEASLTRDRFSPNTSGDYNKKQMSGDRLIGKALLTMLEYDFTDSVPLQLRIVDIGHNVNTGTLINK